MAGAAHLSNYFQGVFRLRSLCTVISHGPQCHACYILICSANKKCDNMTLSIFHIESTQLELSKKGAPGTSRMVQPSVPTEFDFWMFSMSALRILKTVLKQVCCAQLMNSALGRGPAMRCSGKVERTRVWTRPRCTPLFPEHFMIGPRQSVPSSPPTSGPTPCTKHFSVHEMCVFWVFSEGRNNCGFVLRMISLCMFDTILQHIAKNIAKHPCDKQYLQFLFVSFFRAPLLETKNSQSNKSENNSRNVFRALLPFES